MLQKLVITGGIVLSIVLVYLLLISVFGRPLIIISRDKQSTYSSTGRDVETRTRYWDALDLYKLIGLTLDDAKSTLGTPSVDNTLAPNKDRGLKVVVDDQPAGTAPQGHMIVVGYCIFMELADRHFLTLGVKGPGNIDAANKVEIKKNPQEVVYNYEKKHKCDGETIGQITTWIPVRPKSQR